MRTWGQSSSHWHCTVSVLIIAELARGRKWSRNLDPNFCPGRDLNHESFDWHMNTWPKATLSCHPLILSMQNKESCLLTLFVLWCCMEYQPILPTAAVCVICEKGDAISTSGSSAAGGSGDNRGSETSPLMECGICWKILHPSCLHLKYPDLSNEGILNEDLPNSWECPRCCDLGKQGQLKVSRVNSLWWWLSGRFGALCPEGSNPILAAT